MNFHSAALDNIKQSENFLNKQNGEMQNQEILPIGKKDQSYAQSCVHSIHNVRLDMSMRLTQQFADISSFVTNMFRYFHQTKTKRANKTFLAVMEWWQWYICYDCVVIRVHTMNLIVSHIFYGWRMTNATQIKICWDCKCAVNNVAQFFKLHSLRVCTGKFVAPSCVWCKTQVQTVTASTKSKVGHVYRAKFQWKKIKTYQLFENPKKPIIDKFIFLKFILR